MQNNLTKMQKKFLCRFFRSRSIEEAAVACGFSDGTAYEDGVKILSHPQAMEYLASMAAVMKRCGGISAEDALGRIINGRVNEAVILARGIPEEISEEEIRRLDLYNITELKIGKGVCEIKFADKLKAIEKLNEIRSGNEVDDLAKSFFDAIGGAAEK